MGLRLEVVALEIERLFLGAHRGLDGLEGVLPLTRIPVLLRDEGRRAVDHMRRDVLGPDGRVWLLVHGGDGRELWI